MKSILLLLALSLHALAAQVGVKWNPNPAEENILRYEVTYGTPDDNGTMVWQTLDAGPNVRATVPDLVEGKTYTFTVRAYNADGVSEPSDPVTYRVPKPPTKPAGLEVVEIEVSSNLTDWEPVALVPLKTEDPARFIRTRIITVTK